MKRLPPLLLVLIAWSTCMAAEWGPVKQVGSSQRKTVEIVGGPASKLTLTWQPVIIPGGDLIWSTSVNSSGTTFYGRYILMGVSGGSLHITRQVAGQERGATRSASSDAPQTLYVELGTDGVFHFIPEELQDEGEVRVARSTDLPGYFVISVLKTSR
jgi:hypothetical protein